MAREEAFAQVWQYLSPLRKRQTSPLLPPKGHEPLDPAAFPLQTGIFQGTAGGAMIVVVDPPGKPTPSWWAATFFG
jgi:hypothetical protein